MKKIFKLLFLSLFIVSCDSVDFEDTNVNPNQASTAPTSGLLTNAMRSIPGQILATTPLLYTQYLTNGQYPDESRYVSENVSYYGLYSGPLMDLQAVINATKDTDSDAARNTNAVATLMKVYFFHIITDRWGYAPYSEALLEGENTKPKFDSQEDIYRGLMAELDGALAKITTNSTPAGDILLGGNMSRWSQFGNTLKAIMALRMSKRNAEMSDFPKTKFNEAITNGAITSNADNIYYTFLADDNNDNFWQDRFVDSGRKDWLMSDVLVDYMIGNGTDTAPQDPRLYKYAQPVEGTNKFLGADYGAQNGQVDNYSFITADIIANSTAPGYLFTSAQIHFSIAEAIELGWMTGTAKDYFESGIMQSMKQWGVSDADANTFISGVTYNGMQSIAEQKWVALFMQGYESWAEWRRIGGPNTIVKPAILLNGTDIPQRQGYSTTTPNINAENYAAAVAAQGPDNLDTVLWWAKN